jgi:hypothetical protein
MPANAHNNTADAYTVNAIAAIIRREGVHNYGGGDSAALCGVTAVWKAGTITLRARDMDVTLSVDGVRYDRGGADELRGWHRVLADLDNVLMRRAA